MPAKTVPAMKRPSQSLSASCGEAIRVLDYHEHAIGAGANAQAVPFPAQEHLWPLLAQGERFGDFCHRDNGLGTIGQRCNHGGGRAQNIKHHHHPPLQLIFSK